MKSQHCRKGKASIPISKATTPISHIMKLVTRSFEEEMDQWEKANRCVIS